MALIGFGDVAGVGSGPVAALRSCSPASRPSLRATDAARLRARTRNGEIGDRSPHLKREQVSVPSGCRRPPSDCRPGRPGLPRFSGSPSRRLRRRRRFLRDLRLPDLGDPPVGSRSREVQPAQVLCPPGAKDLPRATGRSRGLRHLRLVRALSRRVPAAGQAHRWRSGFCLEPDPLGRNRIFRQRRRDQAAPAPLVARHRRAVLHCLAAAPLRSLQTPVERADLSAASRARVLPGERRRPRPLSHRDVLLAGQPGVGAGDRRHPRRPARRRESTSSADPPSDRPDRWVSVRGSPLRRSLCSTAGLALLLLSLVRISDATPFPGWWALAPTIGTALVLGAGPDAWPNRFLLSSRPWSGSGSSAIRSISGTGPCSPSPASSSRRRPRSLSAWRRLRSHSGWRP